MDNADKVKLTHKEVALFLGDDLIRTDDNGIKPYNLEEEYEKTSHHKSKFIWIMLVLCFAFVGISTFITTMLVSSSNQKISIKIDTFNDLNLRSLLNMVSRSQTSYDEAVKRKESLETELADSIEEAKNKRDAELFTLQSIQSVSTKKSVEQRKKLIENSYETTVKNLEADFGARIKAVNSEISSLEKQVSSYDSAMVSKARQAEGAIDSQRQLHDMEMKKQASKYEEKIRSLRTQLIAQQLSAAEAQRKAIEEVQNTYQTEIEKLKKHISTQNDAMEQLAAEEMCDGFILESKKTSKIVVYITKEFQILLEQNKFLQAAIGEKPAGNQKNADYIALGEIKITRDEKNYIAEQIFPSDSEETSAQYEVKTGDKIFIKLPAPQN